MVKKALILIVVLTFGLVWVVPASAVTGNSTVSATVPSAISISVPSTHALTVTTGTETTTDLDVTVKSNTTWSMTVYKSADYRHRDCG